MSKLRVNRLNSLLKEVINDVIRKDVNNPNISEFLTVTRVDISRDLKHAKVYISVISNDKEKLRTLEALQSASGFISIKASKQVVMRFFPSLKFFIDVSVDNQMRVEKLIKEIKYTTDDKSEE